MVWPVILCSVLVISIILVYSVVYFGMYYRPHLLLGDPKEVPSSRNVIVVQAFDDNDLCLVLDEPGASTGAERASGEEQRSDERRKTA